MSHVDEGVLHAYLDGELPANERSALEHHLGECGACRARLDEEQALIRRAGEVLGMAQPPAAAARPRARRRVRMPLAWAASVILALAVGYALHDNAPNQAASVPDAAGPAPSVAMTTDSILPYAGTKPFLRQQQRPAAPAAQERAEHDSVRADRPPPNVIAIQPPAAKSAPAPASRTAAREDTTRADVAAEVVAGAAAAPPTPSRATANVSGLRGRMVATEWPIIRRGSARDLLGSDPVGVPGLEVREIRRSPAADGTVLVEQRIDSSTIIQLYQRPAGTDDARVLGFSGRSASDRLARYVGGLRVEIAGPLSQDSLNRLLEQLKPLP